jgi:hypothetical protein
MNVKVLLINRSCKPRLFHDQAPCVYRKALFYCKKGWLKGIGADLVDLINKLPETNLYT